MNAVYSLPTYPFLLYIPNIFNGITNGNILSFIFQLLVVHEKWKVFILNLVTLLNQLIPIVYLFGIFHAHNDVIYKWHLKFFLPIPHASSLCCFLTGWTFSTKLNRSGDSNCQVSDHWVETFNITLLKNILPVYFAKIVFY